MKMNRLIGMASILGISLMVGCADGKEERDNTTQEVATQSNLQKEKFKITTTVFPVYDWTKNIVGDESPNVDIEMLMNSGIDLHSYQPTAEDIVNINSSDVFIYVGGVSDGWVEDVLAQSTNEDLVTIDLMEVLGDRVLSDDLIPGMQESEHGHEHEIEEEHDHKHEAEEEHNHNHEHEAEEDHNHEHEHEAEEDHDNEHEHEAEEDHDSEHEDGHDHEHEAEEGHDHEHVHPDEHIWLSLENASIITKEISQVLSQETGNEVYLQNATQYITELDELDEQYEMQLEKADTKTLLFGDRFAFRYLVEDYDLDYYGAFSGCSAETEASFETITFLSKKVDELGLEAVIELESSGHEIAQTIVNNTKNKDQEVLTLDSLQSITQKEIEEGTTYMSVMKSNLEVLVDALNKEE